MPSLKQHCKNSKERTGQTYEDLHKWMDEPHLELGKDHRSERHDETSISEVKEKHGIEGIKEIIIQII